MGGAPGAPPVRAAGSGDRGDEGAVANPPRHSQCSVPGRQFEPTHMVRASTGGRHRCGMPGHTYLPPALPVAEIARLVLALRLLKSRSGGT
ncbi:hypothetical protein GB937_010655 [Aspergillus fischeri]|nr:hypothetical protein GB937_010655 [Aspergillus fischeri]